MKYSVISTSISILILILFCQLSKSEEPHITPFAGVNLKGTTLTHGCLDCICNDYVGENCNMTEICGTDEKCDLLGINYDHYQDICLIGQPYNANNYTACKNDPTCAGQVVVETMKNYKKTHNLNTAMTCEEMLLTHLYLDHDHYLAENRKHRLNKCMNARSKKYPNKPKETRNITTNIENFKYCPTMNATLYAALH